LGEIGGPDEAEALMVQTNMKKADRRAHRW
jgi:hypothetical protein